MKVNQELAKPFLKWAGGKTQLLDEINKRLPFVKMHNGHVTKYVEPFVGSGAVLFDILNRYPNIKEVYIWDINPELIYVYKSIQLNVDALIAKLKDYEDAFLHKDEDGRNRYYYMIRENFNKSLNGFDFNQFDNDSIVRAAQFIFLNRTCFNGLYRVNKKGEFNVPIGKYKNPTICNELVLKVASSFLKNVKINEGDFRESNSVIDEHTLVYFDPPYRPLTQSASFTSYSKFDFNDDKQIDLANYFRELDERGAYLLLSNSDPTNVDENDLFFDKLYKGFEINRVDARRSINSKGGKRGLIKELLISNR